jgi:hypothetical protein
MQGKYIHRGNRPLLSAIARLGAASLLLGLLAGCASTREMTPREAALVAPVEAMIIPPPGGPGIVRVVSSTFPNAIRQDIFLQTQARTAGENKISLVQFAGKSGDGSDSSLSDIPFSQVNLTEEALAAWPDAGMAVSPYYVQNDYGPFGYAIGRPGNGDACIYAWQRIKPILKPSGAIDRGAITVRLQLCKRGAGEQELLEVMYRLRLNSDVLPPLSAPAAIGLIANSIRPVGAAGFSKVIDIPDPVVSRPARSRPVPQAVPAPAAVPVVMAPPPGAPLVPSPTGVPASSAPPRGGPIVPLPPSSTVAVPSPSSSN